MQNSFPYSFQRQLLTMFCNPNIVNPTDNSPQLSFRFICQHDFNNFSNLSQLIMKKVGFTSMLENHKKEFFHWKHF